MITTEPLVPAFSSVAVIVHVPALTDAIYVLVTCPNAFVLPVADAIPQDPLTLGVVVKETGSSNATPDPVVTDTVNTDVLVPSAGTLVELATT